MVKSHIPESITAEHVLAAIEDFMAGVHHDFADSTKYDLVVDGQRYPPKAILGLAAKRAAGKLLKPGDFSGGEDSKCFAILRSLGYVVEPKRDVPSESTDDQLEAEIRADPRLPETEKLALVKSRRGQGLFRDRVKAIEPICRVTGVNKDAFLIASHIKPWRSCTNQERLDGMNGLMLSPHVDRLFDGGWISFENDGSLLTSSEEARAIMFSWHITQLVIVRPFEEQQVPYLAYHRAFVLQHGHPLP